MKQIFKISYLSILVAILYACGGSEAANDKLAELQKLKDQQKELEQQIAELEEELIETGIIKVKVANTVLVTELNMKPQPFDHKIDVRGAVSSRKNVIVSAEAMGKIQSIYVKEGQKVSRGKLLAQLDADVLRNSILEVKTQLELATTIYDRQASLWEQNIGTEVQYLQAKNNKESLENKLKTLKSQLNQYNVYAPFDGVIDDVPVRVGEMAQPGMPLFRVVSQREMYISADVSEAFLGRFTEGQKVEVYFPSMDKTVLSVIQAVGQVIKKENRTFNIEVSLPRVDFPVKPNQVVVLNMTDYHNEEALIVPTKLIQTDSKGSYVYELVKNGDTTKANKVYISPGVTYNQQTEVVGGLAAGQTIAFEGYRDLAQGVIVTVRK
ncbi:efflux RND transporter periplasmic adaptor subunit [Marinoscillum sp. MHG1-6]|uniref:efflux RND transporter periplasmic adaptor subunit n=1 Tax=Marinoscillum sp. MHG1-6 TaxID=2959627 RepID=UPI00215703C0|nr:efflux RND transporter periplasmic adaptor subunit [Marinoscillum sp. MHG1-6]